MCCGERARVFQPQQPWASKKRRNSKREFFCSTKVIDDSWSWVYTRGHLLAWIQMWCYSYAFAMKMYFRPKQFCDILSPGLLFLVQHEFGCFHHLSPTEWDPISYVWLFFYCWFLLIPDWAFWPPEDIRIRPRPTLKFSNSREKSTERYTVFPNLLTLFSRKKNPRRRNILVLIPNCRWWRKIRHIGYLHSLIFFLELRKI